MKIGQTAKLVVKTSEDFDVSLVDTIDFVIETDKDSIHKKYETDGIVEYDSEEKEFLIPLSQTDTIDLSQNEPCFAKLEAQINYVDKSVGKSKIVSIKLDYTLHTKIIADAEPSDNQRVMTDLVIE
jgi:hypothetical protein